jgi:peptide subunit release factor 1 (eRF1)
MISLIIPPKDQVSRAAKMLAEEYVRLDLSVILILEHR